MLLLLPVVAASKVQQVFSKVRYAAAVVFFKVPAKSAEEGGVLVVLLILPVVAVTRQFQADGKGDSHYIRANL